MTLTTALLYTYNSSNTNTESAQHEQRLMLAGLQLRESACRDAKLFAFCFVLYETLCLKIHCTPHGQKFADA